MSRPPQRLHDAIGVTVLDGLHYPKRSLLASIGTQRIGTLSEYANVWKFTYAPAWMASADRFALAPVCRCRRARSRTGPPSVRCNDISTISCRKRRSGS